MFPSGEHSASSKMKQLRSNDALAAEFVQRMDRRKNDGGIDGGNEGAGV